METPPRSEPAWKRLLPTIDARFRKNLPDLGEEGSSVGAFFANLSDAGALRWLIFFQLLIFWAGTSLLPLLALDYDFFFHLAHGRYQAETGQIPTDAYFSFLEPRSFLNYYWLFQRLIYELWQVAGPLGPMVLRAVLAGAILALLALFLFGQRRPSVGMLSALLVFILVGERLTRILIACRPFVFSYLFLLLTLYILEKKPRWLPLLPLVALAWANLHGVEHPVLMAVLLAYAGDEFLACWRRGEVLPASRRLFLWLALTPLALLLSPHFFSLITFPFKSTALASLFILEMQKPQLENLLNIGFGPTLSRPMYGTAVLVFLLALATAARNFERRRLRPAHLVLVLAGAYLALQGYRFTVEFMLLCLPLLATGVFPERRQRSVLATALVASLAGFLSYDVATAWISYTRGAWPFAFNAFPYGVSSFLEKVAPPGGRVFNTANYGGFLMWQVGNRHQIMMDMELQAIFRDEDAFLNRAAMIDKTAFQAFVDHYHPDWVALGHDVGRAATFLHQSERWVPVSFDDSLILLVDRERHPELAEQWRLKELDPWQAKLEPSYRLSPAAAAEAQRLYQLEPRGLRLPALLAQEAIGRKDLPAAETYLATLMEVAPDNADTWNLEGLVQLQRGDLDATVAAFKKALLRADQDAARRLRSPLAHFLADQGNKKAALEQLRQIGPFYDPMPIEELEFRVNLLEELGPADETAVARRTLALRRGEKVF